MSNKQSFFCKLTKILQLYTKHSQILYMILILFHESVAAWWLHRYNHNSFENRHHHKMQSQKKHTKNWTQRRWTQDIIDWVDCKLMKLELV